MTNVTAWVAARAKRWRADKERRTERSLCSKDWRVRKILVIRFSSLGDVVLTLPVFKRLHTAYPDAHIAALVKEAYADILKEEGSVNEVITFAQGQSLWDLCQRVRRAGFDGILDLHANLRSRILSWYSGAAKVTRFRKAAMARRLFVKWRFGSDVLKDHTLDRYVDAARRFLPQAVLELPAVPSKILIIQTAFLGDAVLTTPLVGALRDQFPTSRLAILCTPEIAEVFARHPAVSEIILFDKRGLERSWRSQWKLIRRLKE